MADLIVDLSAAKRSDGADDNADGDDGTDWLFAQWTDALQQRRNSPDIVTRF